MKKICILILCCIFVLSGCQTADHSIESMPVPTTETTVSEMPENESQESPQETTEIIETNELLSVSIPASTEVFTHDDGTEIFSYTAQHMQLIHPDEEVADRVILDFLNRVDAAREDAKSILETAQNDVALAENWYPYFYQILYSPTRIDYGVLSLFGTQNSYSGAHHGSLSCVAANYDMTTGDVLTLGSIMHEDATKENFIEAITLKLQGFAEEYSLFEGFEEGVRDRLGGDENLYEDFFFTGSGLTFFFAPYEIAPYSSGVITIEIPYEELPGLIYDGYFPAEREQVNGKLLSGMFFDTDMEQFNNMAEVNLTTGESIFVVYPEGRVEDVRIIVPGDDMNMPSYTVFAALEMSSNNAVILSLTQEEAEKISIAYMTEGTPKSLAFAE